MTSNDSPTPPPARRRALGRGPGAAAPLPRTTPDPDDREPVTRPSRGPAAGPQTDAETTAPPAGRAPAAGSTAPRPAPAPAADAEPDRDAGGPPRTAGEPAAGAARAGDGTGSVRVMVGPEPTSATPVAAGGVPPRPRPQRASGTGRDASRTGAAARADAAVAETAAESAVAGPAIGVAVAGPEVGAAVGGTAAGVAVGGTAAGVAVAGPEAGGVGTADVRVGGGGADGGVAGDAGFRVRLANFEGPFDLLLQLISKHQLDVTEVALSKVTDEFMAHIRAMGTEWDLDETTEFLVVAATLLDLKAARLLPAAEVEDEADLALLEARDLLFARLLQYRAYKQIAEIFSRRLDDEARRHPRSVGLEPRYADLLPDVVIGIGPERFAQLAVKAMQPRPRPQVYVDHIHAPLVSVQEQARIVVARLRELGEASFRTLVEDTGDTLTVVARFLALLELYREKAVALDQETALGELTVRWTGGDGDGTPTVTDEFDRPTEKPGEEPGKPPRSEEETA